MPCILQQLNTLYWYWWIHIYLDCILYILSQFYTHEHIFNLRGCKTINAVINATAKNRIPHDIPWMGTHLNFNWRQDIDFVYSFFFGLGGNVRIIIIVGIKSALLCGFALHCWHREFDFFLCHLLLLQFIYVYNIVIIILRICNQVNSIHEGRGPVRNIYVTAKGVQRLVQVQMPGYPGGVRHGTLVPPHPLGVLGKSSDGGSRRGVLWGGLVPSPSIG